MLDKYIKEFLEEILGVVNILEIPLIVGINYVLGFVANTNKFFPTNFLIPKLSNSFDIGNKNVS